MTAYIVRHHERHTCLGLFVARSMAELWDLVDEASGDPYYYEWLRISNGSIFFREGEPAWTIDEDERDEETGEPLDPALSENEDDNFPVRCSGDIIDAVLDAKKWKRFDATNVGVGDRSL